jgi:hypothetical protein
MDAAPVGAASAPTRSGVAGSRSAASARRARRAGPRRPGRRLPYRATTGLSRPHRDRSEQVAIINKACSPSETGRENAQRDAFAAQAEAGRMSTDAMMIYKPHLTQAWRTLSSAG